MTILISMNSGDIFKFEITEENYETFKIVIKINTLADIII